MRTLAVDFGTSNTVAAVGTGAGAVRLIAVEGSPLMPSAVFLTDEGTLAVGRDAERQAQADPSRYEPNPKRRIDDGTIVLGATPFPVTVAIAEVLKRIGGEVRRQLGGEPDQVRMTHPAGWGTRRREVLASAAALAGLRRDLVLIPEPVAAATYFALTAGAGPGTGGAPEGLPDGRAVAVYDLGGGTFDAAVVRRDGPQFRVLAEAGLPDLGGVDFDHAIVEHLGRRLDGPVAGEAWGRLRSPVDAASRWRARAFAVDVRDGKEALSRYPHVDLALPDPLPEIHLTRAEFEDLIRSDLARSIDLMARTIDDAGLTPGELAGVFLVGGSSRIPLVARLMQQDLGILPSTLDQPETSVVAGALQVWLGRPPARAPAHVDPPAQLPAPGLLRVRAPLPTDPAPPPPGPRRARRRIGPGLLAGSAIGGALLVGAVFGLVGRGATGGSGGGQVDRPASSASTPDPTAALARHFDDAVVLDYVRPTFPLIESCRPGFGAGQSATTVPRSTTCKYRGGMTVSFGRARDSRELSVFRDTMETVLPPILRTAGTRGHWSGGRLEVYGGPEVGAVYWDDGRSGVFALALAGSGHLTVAELSAWWQRNFGAR
ncbi:MAG: Hsp70 family protein [Actinobacteria bacterium]|nr:Hsp70 family protein [Actinomycetota bacterium]MBI3687325.1 Hsp70 family protein [Actinomycetota bacterium]